MSGLDNHKDNCACPRCQGQARTAERERAEREQAQTRQDAAWFTVMGQGGPDAVLALARQHGDTGRAVRLIKAAGLNAAGISGRWRAEAPAQVSSGGSNPWTGDPGHSPEAMRLLSGYTETDADGNQRHVPGSEQAYFAKVAELTEAREGQRNQRAARDRVLWTDRAGQAVTEDNVAQPLHPQRSMVSRQWEDYRDHGGTA